MAEHVDSFKMIRALNVKINLLHEKQDLLSNKYDLLNEKIDLFIETYAPTNLSISGTTTLGATTVIGQSDTDVLTVNAQTTFNSDVIAHDVQVNNLTIIDNTIIGQDGTDTLTINSTSVVNSEINFNNDVYANTNVTLGTDMSNDINVLGRMSVPFVTIPKTQNNALNIGCDAIVLYHEYSANANIFNDFPGVVILKIKNISETSISVIYDNVNNINVLDSGCTFMYLKNSINGFVLIQQ